MSFYWQQAVPQDAGGQQHDSAYAAPSTWDNINLGGGGTAPQQNTHYGYNFEAQSNGYAGGGYEPYVNPYGTTSNQTSVNQQNQQQESQEAAENRKQWEQYYAQQAAYAQQQEPYIEHQPILLSEYEPEQQVNKEVHQQNESQNAEGHSSQGELKESVISVPNHSWNAQPNTEEEVRAESLPPYSNVPHSDERSYSLPPQEESSHELTPVVTEVVHPILNDPPVSSVVEVSPPVQFSHPIHHNLATALDFGEVEVEENKEGETEEKEENGGWGEDWNGGEDTNHPRTSTPSPVNELAPPVPSLDVSTSPIEADSRPKSSSPTPQLISPIIGQSPTPSSNTFAPPPPIVLEQSEMDKERSEPPKIETGRTETGEEKTPTPTASTDSWVEISSTASDIPVTTRVNEVIPIASSSPIKEREGEKKERRIATGDSDSTQDSRKDVKDVRDRYHSIRQQYPELLNRMNGYRVGMGREQNKTPTRNSNPLLEATRPGLRVPSLSTTKSSTPKDPSGVPNESFTRDISAIEGSRMYGDDNLDMSLNTSRGYGEDIVDAQRRDRHRMRPSSRARSELGDTLTSNTRERNHRTNARNYDQTMGMHGQYGYYPSGRYSMGRHSTLGMPYGVNPYYGVGYRERPQSSYDAAAYNRMERSGRTASEYDAYEYVMSSEESEDEDEGQRNESEEEVRRISHNISAAAKSRSMMSHQSTRMRYPPVLGMEETNYCGFIKMEMSVVHNLLKYLPPPHEFWEILDPIEKVAYLYYSSLWRSNFKDVRTFQLRFKKQFYTFQCDGVSQSDALVRICQSILEHFKTKKLQSSQRAYEASQRQLFSDDRETPDSRDDLVLDASFDAIKVNLHPILRTRSMPLFHSAVKSNVNGGMCLVGMEGNGRPIPSILRNIRSKLRRLSDRASVYDQQQGSDADDVSVDNSPKEPLFFRHPHAFVTFGPGGRIVQVQPGNSISSVFMTDLRCVVKDREREKTLDVASHFKGPLLPNQTPPHIVRAYIQRQMDRIRKSDLSQTDPRNDDIVDCLLVWQLLEMVVQQHGRVIGPDIARLLTAATGYTNKREKGSCGVLEMSIATPSPDPRAYQKFTQYLLEGLVEEAINYAMTQGLYMDAVTLARRLMPEKIELIEKRHLDSRPPTHPLLTLLAVANNEPAPCLTSFPKEERATWKWHAALLFANLSNSLSAMENIRRLGEVLARRECHCAADFCFLSVALLAGMDTFTPPPTDLSIASSGRRHIDLIHASIPDDIAESTICQYGFALTDLHATEIFDYGSRLSGGATALSTSTVYHRRRLQYGRLLSGWGGFSLDAFRYCTEVARTMWNHLYVFTAKELTDLAELADRLHKVSSADESATVWIDSLRKMIPTLQTSPPLQQEQHPQPVYQNVVSEQSKDEPQQQQRERSSSLSSEAAEWHNRQEPLEMMKRVEEERRQSVQKEVLTVQSVQEKQETMEWKTASQGEKTEENTRSTSESVTVTSSNGQSPIASKSERTTNETTTSKYDEEDFHVGIQTTPSISRTQNPLAPSSSSSISPRIPVVPSLPPLPTLPITPSPPSIPKTTTQPLPVQSQPLAQVQHNQPQSTSQHKSVNGGQGLGGWLKKTLIKAIPSSNQMILPDDSKKTIVYDPVLQKWIGEGIEEAAAPPPPPSVDSMSSLVGTSNGASIPPPSLSGTLKAARTSGGSRYFNPLNDASTAPQKTFHPVQLAPPTIPQFGFIPSMPDDAVSDSPFSESSMPTEETVQQQTAPSQ